MKYPNQIGDVVSHITCDYSEVENLVHKVYGSEIPELNRRNYSFAECQETSNDTSHLFLVDGKLDEYDIKQWNDRRFQYGNNMILNRLCADGQICPGNYLVKVSW